LNCRVGERRGRCDLSPVDLLTAVSKLLNVLAATYEMFHNVRIIN
jgi:hypothetical protein